MHNKNHDVIVGRGPIAGDKSSCSFGGWPPTTNIGLLVCDDGLPTIRAWIYWLLPLQNGKCKHMKLIVLLNWLVVRVVVRCRDRRDWVE
jgi:hypothetical protein